MAKLKVKVIPGASCSEVSGWLGDMLKIRVTAQPENGKANSSVVALLAEQLGLPKSAIIIIVGKTAQKKIVEIHGLSYNEVLEKLDARSP